MKKEQKQAKIDIGFMAEWHFTLTRTEHFPYNSLFIVTATNIDKQMRWPT